MGYINLQTHLGIVSELRGEITGLRHDVLELQKALEFYADPATYFAIGILPDEPCGDFINDFSETAIGRKPGALARETLGVSPYGSNKARIKEEEEMKSPNANEMKKQEFKDVDIADEIEETSLDTPPVGVPGKPVLERDKNNAIRYTFPDGSYINSGTVEANLLAAIYEELRTLNNIISDRL